MSRFTAEPKPLNVKVLLPAFLVVCCFAAILLADSGLLQGATQQALPKGGSSSTLYGTVSPTASKSLSFLGAELLFPAQSVRANVQIGIRALGRADIPPLAPAMTNVTKGPYVGYRFTPHGSKFSQKVTVTLPFDPSLLPVGLMPDDVVTYYFDEGASSWKALERVRVDLERNVVISLTDHFTDMINGTITVPDHPTPMSFNPTVMKDIKAADPGAGIALIQPPRPNHAGTARLRYPIDLPPGRDGMEPQLAVDYDSGSGNGWLGMGWDVPMQSITIDTRWGVPRYDAAEETETYTLNGEQLTPVAHRGIVELRSVEKEFHTRVEGVFHKIIRHGSDPTNYWWEIIDKQGTRSFFGGDPTTNGPVAQSTLTDPVAGSQQNIFKWALREVRDTNGNTVKYTCTRVMDSGLDAGTVDGVQLYLSEIHYTGFQDAPGPYLVRFVRDREIAGYPAGRRPDVQIDCRAGFKSVTADLLKRIEISLNDEPIRSYELDYNIGAFEKSRLQYISQFGEGGEFFHRHEFEYFDEVRDAAGQYDGFAAATSWDTGSDGVGATLLLGEGQASALGGISEISGGGHLYLGYNPFAPTKSFSVGGKAGFSLSQGEGILALTDVNGDELPDKIFKSGDRFFYRPNLSGPDGGTAFGNPIAFRGAALPAISKEISDTTSFGPEAYPTPATVMLNYSSTFTTTDVYFSDVNGDGITDLVNGGSVLFGLVDQDGVTSFSADSSDTPVPIDGGAVDAAGLLSDFTTIFESRVDQYPLLDAVRRWVAPFDGEIRITGTVQLEDTAAEQLAQQYQTADGVRVAIQHNDTELWSLDIPETDHELHDPAGVDSVSVHRGDRIYFRVQSVFDGKFDQVAWVPHVAYTGATVPADVNGLNPKVYDAAADFTIGGRTSQVQLPFDGTVRIRGGLNKNGATTDDVTLLLSRNGAPAITRTLPWDQSGTIPLDDELVVVGPGACESSVCNGGSRHGMPCTSTGECPGDVLDFYVRIDSPIDLRQIQWAPELFYTASPEVPVTDVNGDPLVRMHPPYDIDLYPLSNLTEPLESWVAPLTGTVFVVPQLSIAPGSGVFDSEVILTVKKEGELMAKQTIAISGGILHDVCDLMFPLDVIEDDEIHFEYSTRDARDLTDPGTNPPTYDPALIDKLELKEVAISNNPCPFALPFSAPSAFYNADLPDAFPESHRGWAVVGYNGNRDRATMPIDESAFEDFFAKVANAQDYSFESSLAFPQLPFPALNRWQGHDDNCWIAAQRVSSSRMGIDYVSVPGSDDFAGARAVPRLSTGEQIAVEAGVSVLSGSTTLPGAASRGELDFMDMNGDRFPDVLGRDRVQYTTATGGLEGGNQSVAGLSPLRTSSNLAANFGVGFGVGGNPASTRQDAKGNVTPAGTRSTATAKQGSQMPELGFSEQVGAGSSQSDHDLIDLNGDGLPDRVVVDGSQLRVAFNLGYRFAPEELWGSGEINHGGNVSINLGANLGYNDQIYGFGGGASLVRSDSNSDATLADLNGDGLIDSVRPSGNELLVSFNRGAGFAPPASWTGALSDDIAASVTAAEGGGAFFTIGICFPFFGCIIINPGAHVDHSISRPEIALRDLDGDGYVDHVLSGEDHQLEAAINRTGRTNLLRVIRRPLGAVLTMDYQRDGNTVDLPQSRWNLSRVEVHDGFCGDGADLLVNTYEYEGGFYNRNEREFYGYQQVVEQQRDSLNGDVLYRSTTRTYGNDGYYTKGLMVGMLEQDAAGNKFNEIINAYRLVDVATGLEVLDPDSTTATVFPQLVRTDRRFYEGQSVSGKSTFSTKEYDSVGNIIRVFDAADSGTGDDVTTQIDYFADITHHIVGIPNRIVVTSNGVELRRREATIKPGTGDLLQVRQFLANGDAAVTDLDYFPNGNLMRVIGPANLHDDRFTVNFEYEETADTHVSRTHDSLGYQSTATHNLHFGGRDVSTDINGNQTDYDYDAFGRVIAITGPYEAGSGVATLRFEYHPDAIMVPCAQPGRSSHHSWAMTRHIDTFRNINDSMDTVLFVDGLKRSLQTKKDGTVHTGPDTAPQDVMIVSGRITFDHVGRTVEQSYPTTQPLGIPGQFHVTPDGVAPARTQFDILDRTTKLTLPDGTMTTTAYGFGNDRNGVLQFETRVVDANGVENRTFRDVRELITGIREVNNGGAENFWTSYAYDAIRQIARIEDDQHNLTTVEYDNLGRLIALDNPDSGRTVSQYDLAGNLIAKVTANLAAAALEISYDYQFNRPIGIRYPLFPANNVTYAYGVPGALYNRAGRIVTVNSEAGIEERFYGKLGEVVKEIKTVASDTQGGSSDSPEVYTTQYTYDTWNRVQKMTYPDGEVLTYNYDAGGLLRSATGVKNGLSFPYMQKLEYDKFQQRAFMQTQNGIRTTYAYDPLDRRLSRLTAGKPGSPQFQNLGYTYDDVGNILQTRNDVPLPAANSFGGPVVQTYGYDDLYRLVSATGSHQYGPDKTSRYSLEMTYDTIHNITRKRQVHELIQPGGQMIPQHNTSYDFNYTYAPAQPHAPVHIGDKIYGYDANGNQVGWQHDQNGTIRSVVWDEENRIQSVYDNGHEKTYKYDDEGERVIKRGPQGETAYVNPYFTVRNRSIATKHVYAGTTRVASKLTPGFSSSQSGNTRELNFLYFYHPDHLGSSSYVTAEDGKLYEHLQYFPFGETWVQETSNTQRTPYTFTAKELDEETQLQYFGARYYDPRTSVWQSADPILSSYLPRSYDPGNGDLPGVGGVFSATNLAMYTYAGQNPLKMIDPDGRSKQELEIIVAGMSTVMNEQWAKTTAERREWGAAIVTANLKGSIKSSDVRQKHLAHGTPQNAAGGASMKLETHTDKGEKLLGSFHTHPSGKAFSARDINWLAEQNRGNYSIVEAGNQRFALEIVDRNAFVKYALNNKIEKYLDAKWTEYMNQKGRDPAYTNEAQFFAIKSLAHEKGSGLKFYQTTDKDKLEFDEAK